MNPSPTTAAPAPSVHFRIESIVLDGLTLSAVELPHFQSALQSELGRLAAEVPPAQWAGLSTVRAPAPSVAFTPGAGPGAWARQLARSIFAGVQPRVST